MPAPRGNAVWDALRPLDGQSFGPGPTTRSVGENIPTRSVGTRSQSLCCLRFVANSTALHFKPELWVTTTRKSSCRSMFVLLERLDRSSLIAVDFEQSVQVRGAEHLLKDR